MDELLRLVYPEYSLLQHCLRRRAWHDASFPASSASPLVHSDVEDLWGQPRKAPLYKADGTLEGKRPTGGGHKLSDKKFSNVHGCRASPPP